MMFIIPSLRADEPVRVNLKELGIVRQQHMPEHAVRFASSCELERVADEVSRQQPALREEAHFVKYEELHRRERLAGSPLKVVKGDRYDG